MQFSLYDRPELPAWHKGRGVLVADGALLYWPLEEESSRYAGSLTLAGGPARYASAGVTYRAPTATPSVPRSASVTLNGVNGRVRGGQPTAAPDVFTAEVWFKTRTNRGGKILGFGSSNTVRSPSPTRDRQVASPTPRATCAASAARSGRPGSYARRPGPRPMPPGTSAGGR